jgi:GT2 family glycosyltransferase
VKPVVAVIIPTHNRAVMLKSHLTAMAGQTYPRALTEWVIVCDGCTDGSAVVARRAGADQVIETAGGGAAARNAGIRSTHAQYILCLDDDIIPTAGWVEALVHDFQSGEENVLHMGYCPYAPAAIITHLDRRNASWYESKIGPLRDPNHAWSFTDFFGGNFGASRRHLLELGGFDQRFSLFEDAELALRALNAGWRIRFVPGARAEHHAHRGVHDYSKQAFRSGQIDALFARIHPEATTSLRIGQHRRAIKQAAGAVWRALALRSKLSVGLVEHSAQLGERLRLRPALDLFYALLWDAQYWRGVTAA